MQASLKRALKQNKSPQDRKKRSYWEDSWQRTDAKNASRGLSQTRINSGKGGVGRVGKGITLLELAPEKLASSGPGLGDMPPGRQRWIPVCGSLASWCPSSQVLPASCGLSWKGLGASYPTVVLGREPTRLCKGSGNPRAPFSRPSSHIFHSTSQETTEIMRHVSHTVAVHRGRLCWPLSGCGGMRKWLCES